MNKMQFGLIFAGLLLVGLVLGCTDGNNISAPAGGATNDNTVQTLEVMLVYGENWDSDPEVDGITVAMTPRDKDDNGVDQAGTYTAKLWESESVFDGENFNVIKGEFVQEWTGSITEDSYLVYAHLNLEYKSGFSPNSKDMGWVEVTFTTPDGQSFTDGQDGFIGLLDSETSGSGTSESATPKMSGYAVSGNCSVLTDEDITNAMGFTITAEEPFLNPGRSCSKHWYSSANSGGFDLMVKDREDGKTGDILKGTCGSSHEIEQIGDYCTSLDSHSSGFTIYFGKGTYYFEIGCTGTNCDTALLIEVANIVLSRV